MGLFEAPTLRAWSPLDCSMPNSSTSIRSGVIAAALMTTNGAAARADSTWRVRAVSSLPAPEGPTIRMRLLVGATLSMVWRRWPIAPEPPTSVAEYGASCLRSLTSRLRREVSSARSATSTRRSALNGFSMKS
jgi:hypothetical protein